MVDRLAQYANTDYINDLETNTTMLSDSECDLIKLAINKEWTNPKFKMRYFVGETQITPFAKLRQWLLELRTKEESIEHTEYEIKKWGIEIERHKYWAKNHEDPFEQKLNALEAEKLERQQIATKRRLQDWYLERQQYVDLITEFKESDESLLPDGSGRRYFDILNTDEENLYEQEYWTNRLGKQAAMDLLFYGRVNGGNMDAIMSMGSEQQADTLALAHNYATQLREVQDNIQLSVDENLKLNNVNNRALTLPATNDFTKPRDIEKIEEQVGVQNDGYDLYNS
jgi:hypothetical protein